MPFAGGGWLIVTKVIINYSCASPPAARVAGKCILIVICVCVALSPRIYKQPYIPIDNGEKLSR